MRKQLNKSCRWVFQWSFLSVALTSVLAETSLSLTWDPSPSKDTVGYSLYFGQADSGKLNRISIGGQPSSEISGLIEGIPYLIYVTAVNADGIESQPSNVLNYTPAAAAPSQLASNGNFENGFDQWDASGNHRISSLKSMDGSDHSSVVQFNFGQLPATGVLSQNYGTTAGQTYTLSFDLGAYSIANQGEQRMQVIVQGIKTMVSEIRSVFAPGNGVRWASQTLQFVADSSTTQIMFRDASVQTDNVDLLLDNVELHTVSP